MLFHTAPFLYFFIAVFTVYWTLPRHAWRMVWLLIASVAFYMSWNPWLIGLILFSTSVDYVAARAIESSGNLRLRRAWLFGSIGVNLTLLAVFKYADFFVHSTSWTLNLFGADLRPRSLGLILPLGISFYTFEAISYVTDVYRGKVRAIRSALDYGLYILFFPHLIAGPIVRSHDFLPQLARPKRWNWLRAQTGVRLFLIGMFKKVILADHLALAVDPIFKTPEHFGSASVWLAVLAYAGQIYCDFSGYSDMAIGLAHLLGFKLPNNFNLPYLATSLADFWRRWHISLSSWLRDYLYIPLGGSRGGLNVVCRNLILTMLLGGLWHGASWTFIAWGLLHGLTLAAERRGWLPIDRLPRPMGAVATFLVVTIGWIFFRAASFGDAGIILTRMFRPTEGYALPGNVIAIGTTALMTLALGIILAAKIDRRQLGDRLPTPVLGAGLAGAFLLILLLFPKDAGAFIYFQF